MTPRFFYLLRIALTSFAVLSGFSSIAQKDTTAIKDTARTRYFYFGDYGITDSLHPDSTFLAFKSFDRLGGYPAMFVGNPGSARYSSRIIDLSDQPDIISGFSTYLQDPKTISYFNSPNPYSELTFVNGAGREQFFNVLHTQNFGKSLNVKFDLTKRASDGFYNRLRNNHSRFNFSSNFQSKSGKYGFLAYFFTDRFNAQENGGFEDFTSLNNPELAGSSNLDNAVNRYQSNQYFTNHYFRFGKTIRTYDKDSVEQISFKPRFELSYSFGFSKTEKTYEDELLNADFYSNIYFNQNSTFDSIFRKKFSNNVKLSVMSSGKLLFGILGGHEFLNHSQTSLVDTSFNNYFAGGFMNLSFGSLNWRSQLKYYVSGYNAEDLHFKSELYNRPKGKDDKKDLGYTLSGSISFKEPDYFLTSYSSNHFIWRNNFEKTENVSLRGGLTYLGFKLNLELANISQLIYFDESSLPRQEGGNIQVVSANLGKNLQFGKFYLENNLTYQSSSNREILPFPEFLLQETFYYKNYLLQKALLTRIGFTLYYYSSHFGYNYSPALSQFILQQENQPSNLGNYPYLDLFIDLKIKRMKVFFMLSHANEGLSGSNFYRLPNYPLPPRLFRFGLNWKFFN